MKPVLVFVYNADSGLFNMLSDIGHKLFSPATYRCRLCDITHSYFSMRGEWKDYIERLGLECEFLHRDEFQAQYASGDNGFPAAYIKETDGLRRCLGPHEINSCTSMDELKTLIKNCCLPAV